MTTECQEHTFCNNVSIACQSTLTME